MSTFTQILLIVTIVYTTVPLMINCIGERSNCISHSLNESQGYPYHKLVTLCTKDLSALNL